METGMKTGFELELESERNEAKVANKVFEVSVVANLLVFVVPGDGFH